MNGEAVNDSFESDTMYSQNTNLYVILLLTCQIWISKLACCAWFSPNQPYCWHIPLDASIYHFSFPLPPAAVKLLLSSEWSISAPFHMSSTAVASWTTSRLVCSKTRVTNLIFPTSKVNLFVHLHLFVWAAWDPASDNYALLTIEIGHHRDYQIRHVCLNSFAPILTSSQMAFCTCSDVNVNKKSLALCIL